jgi:phosphoenolpyruvate synthase/pyruvate phosphate dikinase
MVNAILSLKAATDVQLVGGKARSLATLIRAGFQVPRGFVITTPALSLAANELAAQLLDAFDALHNPWVAVRSSGLNEDSGAAAWAGQLDTFLNVDRAHVLERVQNCQQSASTDRALAYAKLHQLTPGAIAVIVQQMIQSNVSGVAFSVHPVTQDPDQLLIEAAYGLGEAVVSGEVTPDSYTVAKSSGKTMEKQLGSQTKQLVLSPDGITRWQPVKEASAKEKLQPQQLAELVEIVRKLETLSGFPVDVEWCFADSQLYILQCRPITTLGWVQ